MTNSLREDLVAAMARIYGYGMDINSLMVILKCHEEHPEY